ncbi:MAG: NBR1-Ig-like domain-containing protein [Acidobacteriota bacterium]
MFAQQHPNVEQGYSPEKMFQSGDVDDINIFNGNVILRIPVGQPYPLRPGFAYNLTLTYNSKVWDSKWVAIGADGAGYRIVPNQRSNAGMGWLLSMGRLILPTDPTNKDTRWKYEGADGNEHALYGSMVGNESQNPADPLYTRDGTYLRLSKKTGFRDLEFPDGTIHTFSEADGKLTKIADRFNNALNVAYPDSTHWQLTDQFGRLHVVEFQTWGDGTTQANYQYVLSKVTFNSNTGSPKVYNFTYTTITVPRGNCSEPSISGDPTTLTLPFLSTISLPDGTSYNATYFPDNAYCRSGAINTLTLPTKGLLTWQYGAYDLPTKNCVGSENPPAFAESAGVQTRTLTDPFQGTSRIWTYTPQLTHRADMSFQCGQTTVYGEPPLQELQTTVKMPTGDKTIHFFSIWPGGSAGANTNNFDLAEFGLPLSRNYPLGTNFNSTQTFDCDATGNNCALKRTSYVHYEMDPVSGIVKYDRNRRVAAQRTNYDDDGAKYVAQSSLDYDGLGHYRKTEVDGNLDATGNQKTTFVNYNPGSGTAPGPITIPSASAPWLLETFDSRWTEDGINIAAPDSSAAQETFCFSATTGALLGSRKMSGATALSTDLVRLLQYDSAGNIVEEAFSGGERSANAANYLCTYSPVGDYRLTHNYGGGYGSERYAIWANTSHRVVDNDIDPDTGSVVVSRDSAGLARIYSYDAMGRTLSVQPPTASGTTFEYSNATSGSSAVVSIKRRPAGYLTGVPLAQTDIRVDGFGRVWRELETQGDGSVSVVETKYDLQGLKQSVSEKEGVTNPTHLTTFVYDLFGRPLTITAPDATATTFSYSGSRETKRTQTVKTTAGLTAVETIEQYDALGRLRHVVEPEALTADYDYDVGNRLNIAALKSGGVTQTRTFTYDKRGLLLSENNPETGLIIYGLFDARGNAGTKRYASQSSYDLNMTYDSAARLQRIDARSAVDLSQFRIASKFVYATANGYDPTSGLFSYKQGKLETTIRHNYIPALGDMGVEETSVYDSSGRIVQKVTKVGSYPPPASEQLTVFQTFSQTFSYNDLGLILLTNNPLCLTGIGCGTSPSNAVQSTYYVPNQSMLHSIPGFINSISYNPNGMPQTITHADTSVDTQQIASNTMARPQQISVATNGAPPTNDNAGFVGQSGPPGTMTPGQTFAVWVTMTNTGTSTWTSASQYKLGSDNPQNNNTWGFSRVLLPGSVAPGGSATFNFTITAPSSGGTYNFQWRMVRDDNGTWFGSSSTNVTVTVSATTLPAPSALVATATSTTVVGLTWTGSAGATSYQVERRGAGSGFTLIGSSSTAQYTDSGRPTGQSFVYRVRATNGAQFSGYSNADLATTLLFTDDPIVLNVTLIKAIHVTQLRQAVAAVRAAAGLSAPVWTDPTLSTAIFVKAVHMNELRTNLDQALSALGLSVPAYGETINAGVPIRKSHIDEIRTRVK